MSNSVESEYDYSKPICVECNQSDTLVIPVDTGVLTCTHCTTEIPNEIIEGLIQNWQKILDTTEKSKQRNRV